MGAPAIQTTTIALKDRITSGFTSHAESQADQLGNFFELSMDLFCIAGFDGYFQVLNRAWEEVLGYSREVILETPWKDLVHPEDLRSSLAEAERIRNCGSIISFENRYRCKDGSYRWLLWNATAVPDRGLIYAVGRDITDRKRAELELREAQDELEKRVQERSAQLARSNSILLAEITRCREIEGSLVEAQEKYRSIFQNAVEGIFQSTPDGTYINVNPALAKIKGYDSPEELMADVDDIGRQSYVDANRRGEFKALMEEYGLVNAFEYEVYRRDGKKIWLSMNARAVRGSQGAVAYYEGTVEDITERRRLEDQLRLAQKMEAVGQLAGGIAHDFNNLLNVIVGHGELLLEKLDDSSPLRIHAEQINRASQSAAALVGQLLAFSRKQILQPVQLDLNSVIRNVATMLGSVTGENISIALALDPELKAIKADRGQMEQVLVNLVVNARDAMPEGGTVKIETANVCGLDGASSSSCECADGLVALTVTDTGTGMDPETQSHIFEPFFTTKVRGKGTGLGLATVYGVVKQSGGSISVCSEPRHGTTFKILFPRACENPLPGPAKVEISETSAPASETVLLVEDDTAVREVVLTFLSNHGYTVLEAANGLQALSVAKRFRGPIHLLLTDVVMPGIAGPQMADNLTSLHPEMKVLYVSGYTEPEGSAHIKRQGKFVLQKPFTKGDLIRSIREQLKA